MNYMKWFLEVANQEYNGDVKLLQRNVDLVEVLE